MHMRGPSEHATLYNLVAFLEYLVFWTNIRQDLFVIIQNVKHVFVGTPLMIPDRALDLDT
jgi:hypothetical protein